MNVTEFLRSEIARPFVWGETDCASTCDRWLKLIAGASPREALGMGDIGETEARRLLARDGSLMRLAMRGMQRAGFSRTRTPRAGDVGMVMHRGLVCAAIFSGRAWHSRSETGAIMAPRASFLVAWSCRRR